MVEIKKVLRNTLSTGYDYASGAVLTGVGVTNADWKLVWAGVAILFIKLLSDAVDKYYAEKALEHQTQ